MTDKRFFDLPVPTSINLPASWNLPKNNDDSLMLRATTRWRECNEGLHELFAGVPDTRATLEHLLKQQLDLDGHAAGLQFFATQEQGERFILLTDALAFVFQHPELESTLDQRCRVTGLTSTHALFPLTPLQLLTRLKALGVEQAMTERWNAYWDARAPGTSVSRRERASQLYLNHLEATAQRAFAQRTLSARQLKPLLLLMDAGTTGARLDNQPVKCEQLELELSNNARVKLPEAWVISVGDNAPVEQLLYLPCRPVALQAFAQRSDMQTWLTQQALVPGGLPDTDIAFQYTTRDLPLSAGMTNLLAHQQMAQLETLRNGSAAKPGLAEQGARALVDSDRLDRQRSQSPVFAAPPSMEPSPVDTAFDTHDEQFLFGNLHADIPWPLRQAALNEQRNALEALRREAGQNDHLKSLKDLQAKLEAAEQAADKAASTMLYREPSPDPITLNRQLTALHQAHKDGLHAEAGLQLTLKQLTDEESSLLKALLDTPEVPGDNRVAASLTLALTEQDGAQPKVNTQALNGVFVMTHPDALLDASSSHSVLLYWPGTGGGLQRFANRRELERQLFKMGETDSDLALQLNKISGDALQYALNQINDDFEAKAAGIRQRNARIDQQTQLAEQLEALRTRTLAALQVPVNAARNLAFAHDLEQDRSATLAARLPDMLAKLSQTDRSVLKNLIQAYIGAMHRSHELMTANLEPRDDFTRRHLHARLRKDFNIKGDFDVQLQLPDAVTWEKRYSTTPAGKVETTVMVPGAKYSKMSLEDLAQLNIDNVHSVQQDDLSQRLVFMRLEVTATVAQERFTLLNGINLIYLRKTLPDLDLPKAYERQIHRAFMGSADDSAFVNAHRRECLIEPWQLMLKLQGEFARLQKQINHDDLQILNVAIDASTPEAWRAGGKRVVLLPVHLSAGGKDTPNEGGVTLSGVTFIQEQISGVTLLYTPDSPDDRFLRRYDSLEDARKALFNLCSQDSMINYLASRALQGSVRAHVSRINDAQLKRFDAMISVGAAWPATTSLAAHLLNAHMGRLIEAHRGTSRSNDALYLERYALQGPRAFAYIKMALGLLPFIGTAVALYDAWTAANQAVAAFLRGQAGDGVDELGSLLLCLIDAAMDLLPGEAITSSLASGARTLTRTRQFRALTASAAALQAPSMRQARHVVARFAGYEYEKPLSLAGLQPATHGTYRNVYRHADGDFIIRQGRVFQVEWSTDSRNWRLTGNSRKTYKQPIALDEAGEWDTWFGVYGTTFEGGGLGGGQVLGHLADTLDPLWPAAIRERLPRWWVDRALRRHHALTEAIDDFGSQLDQQVARTDAALKTYNATPADQRASLMQATDSACIGDIEMARRHLQTASDLLPLTHGNKRHELRKIQSNGALIVADRCKHRLFMSNYRVLALLDRIDAQTNSLDELLQSPLAERLRVLEDIRKLRLEMLKEFDTIESLMRDLNLWYQRISERVQKTQMTDEVAMLNRRLSEANLLNLRTGNLLETVTRFDTINDVSWFFLQTQTQVQRTQLDRALFKQFNLPEVTATKAQRNRILQDCIEQYDQFRRAMNAWTISYPQHFHLENVPPLLDGLETLTQRARKALDIPPPPAPAGTSTRRVFTTENDELLIGVEHWELATQQRQYTLTSQDGYTEIWEPTANNRFRLRNPRPQPVAPTRRDVAASVAEARQKLAMQDAYKTRVQSYANQGMLPVDLEDMMLKEANELTHRARDIEALSPQNAVIAQLRDKASELVATGRAMRTRQSLLSKKPTDGMLDDLVTQGVVEVRKTSPLKNLGKRPDGRLDYMQEYEVWDLTANPPGVLWYAHFHYSKAAPRFSEFEKAHLKLPEHRYLTHADNADLPYADIGKRSAVLPHFENL
ncbi:dermonecrotic toxin domain-containing protein [Pseudomonas putida]|uniref:dermonecrotic toxin domain-containing protein n=1 Tax=Pseudomonas putida TaxID=303 RepID=UPI003D98BD7F